MPRWCSGPTHRSRRWIPWLSIAAAVHRSDDDREPWGHEHALTAQEALAASVDGQPMVGVGSRDDLVLLDHDPLAVTDDPRSYLRGMSVALTVVSGEVVHSDEV